MLMGYISYIPKRKDGKIFLKKSIFKGKCIAALKQ